MGINHRQIVRSKNEAAALKTIKCDFKSHLPIEQEYTTFLARKSLLAQSHKSSTNKMGQKTLPHFEYIGQQSAIAKG